MINKIIGVGSILLGLAITIGFPSVRDYQPDAMGRTGVFIGIALIVIGLYLMLT